eukprot:TRINITY_DN1653_c11_g1_i1.p1 TRINITY_DN1653_c11_g1~~TRINITY_DN1653_c11_g1_i1.p1  ORF type:complete len:208 (+),score=54.70 TRINITY_DN1653_c11_g1_i1:66-626(+)
MQLHAVSVILLLSIVIAPMADAKQKKKNKKDYKDEGTAATEEQMEGMPDFGDKEVAGKLKCSACKNVVAEVKMALDALTELRHGKPKSFEVHDALDDMCRKISLNYGILRKNNKPTTTFSRNTAISRLTGNWINSYIETRCGEVLTDHDEDLALNYRRTLPELQDMICRVGTNWCKTVEQTREIEL